MVAAAKIWVAALRQLAELPVSERTSPSEVIVPGEEVISLPVLNQFTSLPSIRPAEWHRVVTDLKVPLKLGQAATANGAPDPLGPRAHAAVYALSELVKDACTHRVVVPGTSPSSLTRSIGQQLRQSGLLAALPRLLEAAAAALDASAHAPDPSDTAQTLCSVISRRYRQPLAQQEAVAVGVLEVVRAHLGAQSLLMLVSVCLCIWPQLTDRAIISVPALRLCTAAFQHCSRCADALPAAAAAPTALEELLVSAWTVAQATCVNHDSRGQVVMEPSMVRSPVALRALSMVVMFAAVAPEAGDVSGEAAPVNAPKVAAAARRSGQGVRAPIHAVGGAWSDTSIAASQVAWQAACARESSLSTAQQQALRELGCSGRALLWVAGHALAPLMRLDSHVNVVIGTVCAMLHHSGNSYAMQQDSPTLDQPQQIRQLAVALSQLQPGDSPPCGSPWLTCAALLWLMPAVLLEWAQGQPTDKPALVLLLCDVWGMLRPCLYQALIQQQFWRQAKSVFAQAAGATGRLGPGQASLHAECPLPTADAAASTLLPVTSADAHEGVQQQPAAQPEGRMFLAASRAASSFASCWEPPADCLALLLQLSSSTAARILACVKDAPAGPSGSSSSSRSGSSSAGGRPGSSSSSSSSSNSSRSTGRVQHSPVAPAGSPFTRSLLGLSTAQSSLMQLCSMCLQNIPKMSTAGSRPAAACSKGVPAQGVLLDSASAHEGCSGEDAASLVSLCAALQQTLPQLAALVEAALRSQAGGGQGPGFTDTLFKSSFFLHHVGMPGPFIAARMQPSSPALKALSGVALTVVKLAGVVVGVRGLVGVDSIAAINCLQMAMNVASLVLQATCTDTASSGSHAGSAGDSAGSSRAGSSSNSDAVINVLLGSSICNDHDAAALSALSTAAAAAAAAAGSTTSLGPGDAAVEVVPWLVVFGRCCLWHASVLQQTPQAVAQRDATLGRGFRDVVLRGVCRVLPGWLQSNSVSAQLSAAGYNTARLLELLQQAPQAQQQARAVDLVQQLQGLGLALTSLPFGSGCNNPGCSVLGGLSEQQLVVGTARLCGGCRVARYCCRACQVAAWKLHKPACKAIAAARAAENPAVA